jgi:cyclophilin family peptidyl-prolyl cis-trans isomerase/HEAT repeat protein
MIIRIAAVCLSLLVSSSANAAPAQPDPSGLLRDEARILRFEDMRAHPDSIEAFLRTPDAAIRGHAAIALGRIGRRESIPLLDRLLGDPDPEVRASAAFALGEIEDSSASAPLAHLLAVGREGDAHTRALAVEGLGKRGVPRHAQLVVAALRDPADEVREAACLAAWQIRAASACRPLLDLAAGAAGELRWKATYALMRMLGTPPAGRTAVAGATEITQGERAAIRELLIRRAEDPDVRVRLASVRGLGRFEEDEARAAVRSALRDSDGRVRVEAVRAASATTPLPSITPLLDDPDGNVRITALEALGRIGDRNAAIALLRSRFTASVEREREVAALAISARLHAGIEAGGNTIPDPDRLDLIALANQLLQSGTWTERAIAGSVLAGIADSTLWARVLRDDPRVALQGVEPWLQTRLALRGGRDSTLAEERTELGRLLASQDPVLRTGVFEALTAWAGDSTTAARLLMAARLTVPDMRPDPRRPPMSMDDYATILRWAKRDHRVEILTEKGPIRLRLFATEAPLTCWNFVRLADSGFYDRGRWHRIVPDFVVQDGCPRGDGSGGPGYTIRCEINEHRYVEGALGMALSGKDTGGSQFFITISPQPHLDGRYTVFGQMIEGSEVLGRLVQGDRIESVRSMPAE